MNIKKNPQIRLINLESESFEFTPNHISHPRTQKDSYDIESVVLTKSLKNLLGNSKITTFLKKHFLKAPFFGQSLIDVESIFSMNEILEGISINRFHSSKVHFYSQSGSPMPMSDYELRRFNSHDHIFKNAGSISVRELQWSIPAIRKVANDLQKSFHCNVNVNAYLTPPGQQTFSLHWDDHDTLALQITGHKTWHAFDAIKVNPVESFVFSRDQNENEFKKIGEFQMSPRSFLYLPRGTIHKAIAQDDVSLHITFGLHQLTGAAFLKSYMPNLLDEILNSPEFGEIISLKKLSLAPKMVIPRLKENLKNLIEQISWEDHLKNFGMESLENLDGPPSKTLPAELCLNGVPFISIKIDGINGFKTKNHALILGKKQLRKAQLILKNASTSVLMTSSIKDKEVLEIIKNLYEMGILKGL